MALNRARVAADITLSSDLAYIVTIEYFDSANAAAVLWREIFTVPIGATTGQLQTAVVDRGQAIRAALAAQSGAQAAVPSGTVVTVP